MKSSFHSNEDQSWVDEIKLREMKIKIVSQFHNSCRIIYERRRNSRKKLKIFHFIFWFTLKKRKKEEILKEIWIFPPPTNKRRDERINKRVCQDLFHSLHRIIIQKIEKWNQFSVRRKFSSAHNFISINEEVRRKWKCFFMFFFVFRHCYGILIFQSTHVDDFFRSLKKSQKKCWDFNIDSSQWNSIIL